ncbi:MAG: twin-arginine translocase TatA/TatE family subunit [Anaerolineaceae bacterium]|jgi:sec-independent protein translocase protein TatA|nr:twin-arginine translocase TatA/TatE family subunit [Anaerolineaceae bacterium]
MKIFNVGAPEILLIALLALVIFGPKRLVQVMRDFGAWLRSIAKSPLARDFVRTTQDIRNMPNELLRESGLDQDLKEIQRAAQEAARIDEIDTERAKQNEVNETQAEEETQNILPPAPPQENNPQNPA